MSNEKRVNRYFVSFYMIDKPIVKEGETFMTMKELRKTLDSMDLPAGVFVGRKKVVKVQ